MSPEGEIYVLCSPARSQTGPALPSRGREEAGVAKAVASAVTSDEARNRVTATSEARCGEANNFCASRAPGSRARQAELDGPEPLGCKSSGDKEAGRHGLPGVARNQVGP